jgi:hypothetical protein
VNKHENRRRALVLLEIVLVGLLVWTVLTSDGAASKNAQASNATAAAKTKNAKRVRNQIQSSNRSVPPEGVPEAASASLFAQLGTPNACQGFDFESGDQGFTVQSVTGTPLWHVTNNLCRAQLAGHSTPSTFYYGQDGTCNYDTGARNASNLVSPSISLAGIFPPYSIGFNYLLFVEGGGFDTTFVDISTDNGTTWTQVLSKANLINDNQWHNAAVSVTAQVGTAASVRLRFRFDTIDNIANATTGWHIDDVLVCGQPFNACIQDDSSHSVLNYNSVTGAYEFNSCDGTIVSGTGTLIVKGSTTTLQDSRPDRRVLAKIDRAVSRATASIQLFSPSRLFTITDRNTADDTCTCP